MTHVSILWTLGSIKMLCLDRAQLQVSRRTEKKEKFIFGISNPFFSCIDFTGFFSDNFNSCVCSGSRETAMKNVTKTDYIVDDIKACLDF